MLRFPAAALLSLAACAPAVTTTITADAGRSAAAAAADSLATEYVAAVFERNPHSATTAGYPGADHGRMPDNSLAALRAWEAREDAWLAAAGRTDPALLQGTASGRTLAILTELLEASRDSRVCRQELWHVSPTYTGWQAVFAFVPTVQPVGSERARNDVLSRFAQFPRYLDTEIENLREGMRLGYLAPRTGVESVIAQLDALLAGGVDASPFISPAARDTAAPPQFRQRLTAIIGAEIFPAIERYRDFLREEYLPVARPTGAVADVPGGAQCYEARIRAFTTLRMTPREIHETGLRQGATIRTEMEEIARRSFGTDDVGSVLQRLRTDTAFTFRTRQAMIDYAQAAVDRARVATPNWFGIVPRADVVIQPYPEFQERAAPGGQYSPAPDDGSRPGTYLINTYDPPRQSRAGLESTAFHETYPGHHLQIAIARERPGAHPLVRYFGNSGFVEGWALYSERLSDEMGLFSGDVDRMGLLSNEAFRAVRLVVDPGLHALGWTRQQAIDYMMANTTASLSTATAEIDRYIAVPGQATSYMLGALEIRRLRDMAERELGSRFSIQEFHDRVLEDGSVTLPMLRAKIENWIAGRR